MWRRLKNLWRLSAYRIEYPPIASKGTAFSGFGQPKLVKDIVTIKKQPAKIVNIPEAPFFEPNEIKEV